MSILIPAHEDLSPLSASHSPFHRLTTFSRSELANTRSIAAEDRRLLAKHFVKVFQWETVRPHLPIRPALPPASRGKRTATSRRP